uniref:Peptidase S9 prolyl oligopeptidase catalytic domain-containing protein n=1 Tax=Picea sitchensis TaxID=3332 RepID=A9NWZ2_PICSI|nr:unknown [Picea sitchensis]
MASFSFSCAYLRPLFYCRSITSRRGIYTVNCLRQSSADHKTTDMYAERIEVHKEKMSAPYGSWKSPITADIVSGADKRLGGFALDGEGRVIWLEGRPTEAGRSVLVREAADEEGTAEDITPAGFNVRTLVHEYGGGAFTVSGDVVVFSNYKDQRLYKQSIKGGHAPIALTPDYGAPVVRYADGVMDLHLGCYVTVREDHRESDTNPTTTIVSVELNGAGTTEPHVLVSGSDFYAFPRLTPDGGKMAWIEWNHPNMPWDKSELWVGYMSAEGKVEKRICIAGNDPNMIESPTEPKWSSQGELFFVTDRKSGFWNLYKWVESTNEVKALYPLDAEFTRPSWVFGNSSYAFIEQKGQNKNIACTYRQKGMSYLGILDHVLGSFSLVDLPFTDIYNITSIGSHLYLEGASPLHPLSIVKVSYEENLIAVRGISIIWSSSSLNISEYSAFISSPEIVEFSTKVPGQTAFAYLYLPSNYNYEAPEGEKPPLLVKSHGGPTSESHSALDLSIQYWTSRGWAFADVNYGGSTGYGREYRERLNGSWGIVDVNDCCSCAEFLVTTGRVDGERLCITGRSAGGYTTLAALVFRETFKAGASLFGVADVSLLKADTHKFESYYTDSLVGKDESLLYERSPINFVDRLSCPMILFQGLEDKVVPPEQARKIYAAVKEKGLPVALVEYEGEQHGFRKAENIKYTLEQQMVFFARLIGNFKVADDIIPVHIENFD